MGKRKGRGNPPQATNQELSIRPLPEDDGYLLLSFRHLQPRFGVDEMTEHQRSEFLRKWAKRCTYTWKELHQPKSAICGLQGR